VTPRVSPTEQLRAEIDVLFGGSDEERQPGDTLEEVARVGAHLLLQSALEAEVTEFLCRNRYERRAAAQDARAGSRNGYGDLTVKTTAGPVTLKRPKLRGTTEQFASRLLGKGVTRTNSLESLVIAGFIRGLSVRDVEAALAEALGPEATVSKSTVSRVCQAIKEEFDAFRRRDLSDVEARVPVLGRQPLQVPRRRQGRAGTRRLGDHHDRQAGAVAPGPRRFATSRPTTGPSSTTSTLPRAPRPRPRHDGEPNVSGPSGVTSPNRDRAWSAGRRSRRSPATTAATPSVRPTNASLTAAGR
jgi:putative transposase